MSITLKLPPEIEDALVADATERGVPVEELATHAMHVFISYSAPFEKLIQRAGRLNRVSFEAPTGVGKTDAVLQWIAAMHDVGKGNADFQYQMSVLHAAIALQNAFANASIDKGEEFAPYQANTRSFGFLQGQISGSAEFLAEKHAETAREREKDENRANVMGKPNS